MPQHSSYKDLLLDILKIIGYQNNKEKFATEFELLNQLDAVASIVDTYPADIQEKVKACKTADEIGQYIGVNEYQQAYITVSRDALQDFLASIVNTLTIAQKQRIINLIS
jgi:hypothetical protein